MSVKMQDLTANIHILIRTKVALEHETGSNNKETSQWSCVVLLNTLKTKTGLP